VLPMRDNFSVITSYVDFYWLRVHFVLGAAPGFSEVKPAIQEIRTVRSSPCVPSKLRFSTVWYYSTPVLIINATVIPFRRTDDLLGTLSCAL
jgi:hypothetical protein